MAPPLTRVARFGSGLRLLVGLAGVALVALGYYFFFYSDLSAAVVRAKSHTVELRNEEQTEQAAYQSYLEDSTRLEEKKARSRELNKALPETSEMASFLGAINQQAEVAGLKVKSVVPVEEQAQPFYTRVPVKLEVSGRFHQLAKFFAGVGRLDRIINIENIELTDPKVGDNDETTLSAKCLATTFHLNATKPAAAVPAPGAPGAAPGASATPRPGGS